MGPLQWGDVPTWVGGTGALAAAWYAYQTITSQRQQIGEQRDFIAEQTRFMDEQRRTWSWSGLSCERPLRIAGGRRPDRLRCTSAGLARTTRGTAGW